MPEVRRPITSLLFMLVWGGAFAAGGLFFAYQGLLSVQLALVAEQTECEVESAEAQQRSDDDDTWYVAYTHCRFTAEGRPFVVAGDVDSFDTLPEAQARARTLTGTRLPCWFDPGDPERAKLEAPSLTGSLMGLVMGLVFALIPVGVGIRQLRGWGRSREAQSATYAVPETAAPRRRAGAYRRAAGVGGALDRYGSLDHLPLPQVRHEPGRELPIALTADVESTSGQIMLVVVAVFWNGFCWPMFFWAISSQQLLVAGFLLLFVGPGAYIAWLASKPFTKKWRRVPTLELAEEPVVLGQVLRVAIRQPGGVHVNHYELKLVCEEWIRYRVGTDTRTDSREIFGTRVFADQQFAIPRGRAFLKHCEVTLPEGLPPSFHAEDNRIVWKFVVTVDIARFPDLEETYTIRVLPPVTDD